MPITIKSDQENNPNIPNKSPFRGIGKNFRTKIDTVKEYEIIEENEDIKNDFFYGMPFGLNYNDYVNAQNLKAKLINKYQDMQLPK